MTNNEIREWAENLMETNKRVDWQKSEGVTGQELARIIRAENPEATGDDLYAIATIINMTWGNVDS